MTATFTAHELRTKSNLSSFEFRNQEDYIFIDTSHACWQGDVRSTLGFVARLDYEGIKTSNLPIFMCRKNPSNHSRPYHQVAEFKSRAELKKYKSGDVWVYTVDPMLRDEKAKQKAEANQYFRGKNLPLKRFYMMGDLNTKLECPLNHELLDEHFRRGKIIYNLAEGHHIVCIGGTSIQKNGEDPAKLVLRTDLTEPSVVSRAALEDMMRLTFLGASAHRLVHQFRNSDVNSYMEDELPWALRCEANYIEFTDYLTSLGHDPFPSYNTWMTELTLEHHGIYDKGDYMLPEEERE